MYLKYNERNEFDATYLNLLENTLNNGSKRVDRTGTGTYSIFGGQYAYDIHNYFPLLTTKRVHWKSVVGELLWFLSGSTNANELRDKYGVTIWDEWKDTNGDLGPVYGKQWRDFSGVDQISNLIEGIKSDPFSRRHIVSAWNPKDIPISALPPCHTFFQFYVTGGGYLDCQLYQRSADVFLGVPFNIASYSLLTYMVAQVTNLKPGRFIHTMGDRHVYLNHVEAAQEQLSRRIIHRPPTLKLNTSIKNIFDFTPEDIYLENYESHPTIKAKVSV